MERKLVKQGRNALTVTLPAKWLQQKGLKAGAVVYISEGESLTVSSRTTAKKSATINVVDCEKGIIWHLLNAKYMEGHDMITIHHNSPKIVQDVAKTLIGMVVEEHTSTRTVVRDLIVVPEDNFNAVLRRAAYILIQEAKTLEQMTKGEATMDELVADERLLDDNILYCLRYLNRYGTRAYKDFLICATLEAAGDCLKQIAKYIGKNKELAALIVKVTEEYVRLLFQHDLKKLSSLMRSSRNQLTTTTFVNGLVFSFIETLYNYIGYTAQ